MKGVAKPLVVPIELDVSPIREQVRRLLGALQNLDAALAEIEAEPTDEDDEKSASSAG